jgi:hypothetical protein
MISMCRSYPLWEEEEEGGMFLSWNKVEDCMSSSCLEWECLNEVPISSLYL